MPSIHTDASWLKQVERWFGIITHRAIRRGSFSSVVVLIARIEQFMAAQFNKTKAPFNWTATANQSWRKCSGFADESPGRINCNRYPTLGILQD
ncbi:hypothetical protein [Vulcanococcus limneticus]|uniref:hypothetical protein n=1 Tax=Vulcanococcus limneticus TaxID=2170428 RepID=UPI00398BF123